MAITQGSPLPDVTVTQTAKTTAPDWYTNYLSNLATTGQGQVAKATTDPSSMVAGFGALQQQAQSQLGKTAGTYGGQYLDPAKQMIGTAGGMSAVGAATPYLTTSALGSAAQAAQPFIQQATGLSAAGAAQPGLQGAMGSAVSNISDYMNPYTKDVVSEIGRLGQQNIQQNLLPQTRAAGVSTGALGSRRAEQVMGQTLREALQDIGGRQAQALSSGYTQALGASQADLARQLQAAQAMGTLTASDISNLLQAGQATGQLTSTDLARMLTAGQTAGQLTSADIASKLSAGREMGALGQTAQSMNIADINALSTLGAQQQALEQAKINAPLTTAANAAALIKGYTVPTSTEQVYKGPMPGAYSASPLQQLAGLGALFASGAGGSNSPIQNFISILRGIAGGGTGNTGSGSDTIGGGGEGPIDTIGNVDINDLIDQLDNLDNLTVPD